MSNARVLLGLLFLVTGVNHILTWNASLEYMRAVGITVLPQVLLPGAIALLLVGGGSLLVGFEVRLGSLLLILFLVPTTLLFHDFWNRQSPAEAQRETISFLKNVAILGGLLMILAFGEGNWGFGRGWWRRGRDKGA